RGAAYQHKRKYTKAFADYQRSFALEEDGTILANISGFFSSHPEKRMRDGRKAWEYAKKAIELTPSPTPYMYTALASAFAECTDFEPATKYLARALENPDAFSTIDLKNAREALAAYKGGKNTYWDPEREDE